MNTTPATVRTEVLTAVEHGAAGVTVYDGAVPGTVPQDGAGFIRPYLALYMGAAVGDRESIAVCGLADTASFTRRFTTTLVAASPRHLDAMADMVRAALTNLWVGPGMVHPDYEQQATTVALLDPATSPARYYLPLQWVITTQ